MVEITSRVRISNSLTFANSIVWVMEPNDFHILSRPRLKKLVEEKYDGDPYSLIEELSFKLASLQPSSQLKFRPSSSHRISQEHSNPTNEVYASNAETQEFAIEHHGSKSLTQDKPTLSSNGERRSRIFELWHHIVSTESLGENKVASVELNTFKPPTEETEVERYDVDKYGFYINYNAPLKTNGSAPLILTTNGLPLLTSLKEISRIHEGFELQWSRQWQSLVSRITRDHQRSHNPTTDTDTDIYGIGGINIGDANRQELLTLVGERGIPPQFRGELWFCLSGAHNIRVAGEYNQLIRDLEFHVDHGSSVARNVREIDLDVVRTLWGNCYFNVLPDRIPGPCQAKLRRILLAFVSYKPDIGYYQGMNKIVGHLLLYSMYLHHVWDEEDVFWIFVAIATEVLPKYDYQPFFSSMKGISNDQVILERKFLPGMFPELASHLQSLDVELATITVNWWLTFFIGVKFLDMELWLKVVDVLLVVEPTDRLYLMRSLKMVAMILAILKCVTPALMLLGDAGLVYQYLDGNLGNKPLAVFRGHDLLLSYQSIIKQLSVNELEEYRRQLSCADP